MTFQISRRAKEYIETAQTLLRAAKSMTDAAIASQLKALADDYQGRAERASHVDATKALARSAASDDAHRSAYFLTVFFLAVFLAFFFGLAASGLT
jgi:hypothetical protein